MLRHPAFLKDPYIRTALSSAAGVLLLGFVLFYRYASEVHHLIVIHFDRFRSINFFGTTTDLLNIWVVGCMIGVINALLIGFWHRRDHVAARLLAFMTLAIQGLILLAIGVIISVN